MSDTDKTTIPNEPKYLTPAMLGAWRKGYAAYGTGETCPYLGHGKKHSGFRSAFRNAWHEGYNAAVRAQFKNSEAK